MDQPVQMANQQQVEQENPKKLKPVPLLVLIVVTLIAFGIGFFFYNKNIGKQPQQPEQPKVETKQSTQSSGIDLNRRVNGHVVSIDKEKITLRLEISAEAKKTYQIKITDKTVINRPATSGTNSAYVQEKFENFRIGSVLDVIVQEDPQNNSELTALIIVVLV